MQWKAGRAWTLSLTSAYEHRDFDNRPSGGSGSLEYDKFFVSPAVRYKLSDRYALFSYYTFSDRDTNRNFGSDFRDFEIHSFLSGISFSF